jgi:hypothetical protein
MLFGNSVKGYMRLDFLVDGRVRLGVLAVREGGKAIEEFSAWLSDPGSVAAGPK